MLASALESGLPAASGGLPRQPPCPPYFPSSSIPAGSPGQPSPPYRRESGGPGEPASSHQPSWRHRDGRGGSQGKGITQPAISKPPAWEIGGAR